jgi:hypothetical protein
VQTNEYCLRFLRAGSQVPVLMPINLATWEAEIRRIAVWGQAGQIVLERPSTPHSKITTTKWTGDVAQVVEHLLCKCKALNSNYNPTKKKFKSWETGLNAFIHVVNFMPFRIWDSFADYHSPVRKALKRISEVIWTIGKNICYNYNPENSCLYSF